MNIKQRKRILYFLEALLVNLESHQKNEINSEFLNLFSRKELIEMVLWLHKNYDKSILTEKMDSELLELLNDDANILAFVIEQWKNSINAVPKLSQEEANDFFDHFNLWSHYLRDKPVEQWDEYDKSNYYSLLFKHGKTKRVFAIFTSDVRDEDNSNRSFLLYIDESEEQDERIMAYQRKASAGRVDIEKMSEATCLLQNVQRLLNPIRIINPYAEYLILPKSVFKPRRTNAHYLQFIEAITFYHQHQRESKYDVHTGEEYIESTLEDIKMANDLIKEILLRKSDPLNGATRNYLERLKTHLINKKDTIFSNQEIRRELRVKESTLRRYHQLLLQEGYIKKRNDIQSESFSYEIVDVDEFKNLEDTIDKALNLCLEKLEIVK